MYTVSDSLLWRISNAAATVARYSLGGLSPRSGGRSQSPMVIRVCDLLERLISVFAIRTGAVFTPYSLTLFLSVYSLNKGA